MTVFAVVVLVVCVLLIPFAIYMAIKQDREFFEEHGRHPGPDDYPDDGMWP